MVYLDMRSLTIAGVFTAHDGYGVLSIRLADDMRRLGWDVQQLPRREYGRPVRGTLYVLDTPRGSVDAIAHHGPHLYINTMYEATALPDGWVPLLNRARAVIVPSTFCAGVFAAAGVDAPLYVVPEEVDTAQFRYIKRPPLEDGLTTLIVGTLEPRKNHDIAVAAWRAAAGPHDRLFIKASPSGHLDISDPRIVLLRGMVPDMALLYHTADILMCLGTEGAGLPLLEGMATGLPVIALDAGGQADVCADGPVVPVPPAGTRPHDCATFGRVGEVWFPHRDDVAGALDALKRDPARRLDLGRRAAAWVRKHRPVGAKARHVTDIIETHGGGHPAPHALPAPATVAIWRTGVLGDTLLLAPLLRAIRHGYPDVHIHVWAHPEAAYLLYHLGLADTVADRRKGFRVPAGLPAPRTFIAFEWDGDGLAAAAEEFECFPTVIEWPVAPAGIRQARYMHDVAQSLLPNLGPYDESPFSLPTSWREPGADGAILLNAGASSAAKCWQGYPELGRRLTARGYHVIHLEAPGDDAGDVDGPIYTRSMLPMAWLMQQAACYVGNDTGPTHLAGLLGVPTLVLFGPTQPKVWAPIGNAVTVLHTCERMTRTDEAATCREHECFADLTVDMVEAAVLDIVAR